MFSDRKMAKAFVSLCSLLLVSGCETMPGMGTSGEVVVKDKNTTVAVIFSDKDRQLIGDYYAGRKKRLPPGLAKKKQLPPGLQKQLERNGQLPPGLQERGLPGELDRKLSQLPEGYARVVIGTDVVLKNIKTRVIVDIIKDIAID